MTSAIKEARKTIAMAALDVAEEITNGKLHPQTFDASVVAECRTLAFQAVGPGDPLWPDQVELARQVLALGGVPAAELAEWAAVQREAEGVEAVVAPSWIETALAEYVDEPAGREVDVRMLGRCRCGKPNCGGEHELSGPSQI